MLYDNILVYCVSCSKSMFVGNRQPRYLVDLLFNEKTNKETYIPNIWHDELNVFIDDHREYEEVIG